jgi:dihydropteroate synthase type 2
MRAIDSRDAAAARSPVMATPARPQIFGILNITEDSFSDGGRYVEPAAAIAHARALLDEGADVLDIGAASSNPRSAPVPAETEIARLAPVIEALKGAALSIDSFNPKTQAWALGEPITYLNDVRGFPDASLYPALAASRVKLIVMHSVAGLGPATRDDVDPGEILGRIERFFDARLAALEGAGIARARLIIDPGMGLFLGRRTAASLKVLANLSRLKARYRLPLLISVSRKSFLREIAGRPVERAGPASLAGELAAALQGADMIRTHEPGPLRDALSVFRALNLISGEKSAED